MSGNTKHAPAPVRCVVTTLSDSAQTPGDAMICASGDQPAKAWTDFGWYFYRVLIVCRTGGLTVRVRLSAGAPCAEVMR